MNLLESDRRQPLHSVFFVQVTPHCSQHNIGWTRAVGVPSAPWHPQFACLGLASSRLLTIRQFTSGLMKEYFLPEPCLEIRDFRNNE